MKEKIKPIEVKVKYVYEMRLKVDTNDADLAYHKIEVREEDIPHIRSVCKALKKLDKTYEDGYRHNYPSGGKYGYSMERITGCTAKKNLVKGGLSSDESFKVFDKYIGRKCFHTIHQIDINGVNLYLSSSWLNWNTKKKLDKAKLKVK